MSVLGSQNSSTENYKKLTKSTTTGENIDCTFPRATTNEHKAQGVTKMKNTTTITTLLSRISSKSITGSALEKNTFSEKTLEVFIENYLQEHTKNAKLSIYIIACGTTLTYARKKYRDSWEEITVKDLEKLLEMAKKHQS